MDLTPPPYRPHRGLAIAAIVLITGVGPLSFLIGMLAALIGAILPGGGYVVVAFVVLLVFGFVLGSGILFLVWLAGAYRNLPALGSTKAEISPGLPAAPSEAVWSFLIPIVNLFRAQRVMRHVWIESQPEPALLADGTVLLPKTRLVDWWYGAWVASSLLGVAARMWAETATLAGISSGVAGILCCLMVWRIEERQAAQLRDMQLRQPAPPVVDNLR